MDRKYQYREKNVHDLTVGAMTVRVWSVEAAENRAIVKRLFEPLAHACFVAPYVALMPDWHPGKDAVVGSVVPSRDVLLPAIIGGDIGCGVCALPLPFRLRDLAGEFTAIGRRLREVIPVGTAYNSSISERVRDHPLWLKEPRAPISSRTLRKLVRQFGSLGGGNHFLELQADREEGLWAMLHSGSRYLGVQVRDWYIEQGASQAGVDKRLFARVPHLLKDSPLALDYLADMRLVVEFARESRREMMLRTLEVVREFRQDLDVEEAMKGLIDINHNYVEIEEHFGEALFVHRKGAIRVRSGMKGLIPGSMGTSSYVIEGRGNAHAFYSSAHGGGRRMSRSEAARTVTRKAYAESLAGIVCAHSGVLLDEAPEAYKDISIVMRGQADLVKSLVELMPVLSVKGR